MSLPLISVGQSAIVTLYSIVADRKTRARGRAVVASLNEMLQGLVEAYAYDVTVAIGDTTDAGPSEAFAVDGQIGLALGRVGVTGDIFETTGGTADFTGNELATAKGGAVASNDRFQISGADAIVYLGTAVDLETATEQVSDFAVKAGN